MKLHILSVHDSKAEAFIQPFFAQTVAVGLRMFEAASNDTNTDFNRFAGDYTLFELGTFDQITGQLEMLKTPNNLGLALQFRNTPTPIVRTEVVEGHPVTMVGVK